MPETPLNQLEPGLQRQVEHARSALDRGNPDHAIGLFRDVLRREPGCLAVRRVLRAAQIKRAAGLKRMKRAFHLGIHLPGLWWAGIAGKRKPVRAMDLAERILDWNPRHPAALRTLAAAAMAGQIPETAIFAWESVVEVKPSDHRSAFALARTHLELGQNDKALVLAEKWGRQRPGDAAFRDLLKEALVSQSLNRGRWDSDSGSYRDKLRDEEQAIDLEKRSRSNAPVEASKAVIAEALKGVEKDPQALVHHVTLVRAYQETGDFDQALEWLGRARELQAGASDPSLARRGVEIKAARLTAGGGSEDAVRELRVSEFGAMVTSFPREASIRLEWAGMLREAGRLDEAIRQFQEVQGVQNFRVRATAGLADCFRAKGLIDLAIEQYQTARDGLPEMDDLKKHITYELASCYESTDQKDKATAEYKKIYSVDIGYRDVSARIESGYGGRPT